MEFDHAKLKVIFIGGLILIVLLVGIFLLNYINLAKTDVAGQAYQMLDLNCKTDADCGEEGFCLDRKCAEKCVVSESKINYMQKEYVNQCVAENNLKKYSCVNNQLVMEIFSCDSGCSDAKCNS